MWQAIWRHATAQTAPLLFLTLIALLAFMIGPTWAQQRPTRLALVIDQLGMAGVDGGHEDGHVRLHAEGGRGRDHRHLFGQLRFQLACFVGLDGRKHQVQLAEIEVLGRAYRHVQHGAGRRLRAVPAERAGARVRERFAVALTGRALRSSQLVELEPGNLAGE